MFALKNTHRVVRTDAQVDLTMADDHGAVPQSAISFDLISFDEPIGPAPPLTPSYSPAQATKQPTWHLLTPSSNVLTPPLGPLASGPVLTETAPPSPSPNAKDVPLPPSPHTTGSTHEQSGAGPCASPALSTSALSPTAPAFARRIPVKKSAKPPSFFGADNSRSSPVSQPAVHASHSSPSSPETFRHTVYPGLATVPTSAYSQRVGLGLTPTPVPPYTFHGDILVATGVRHRQLSLPVSRPVRITRPPTLETVEPRSTTPFSSTRTVITVLPDDVIATEDDSSQLLDDSPTAIDEDYAVARLARSLSQVSIISEESKSSDAIMDSDKEQEPRAVQQSEALVTSTLEDKDHRDYQASFQNLLEEIDKSGKDIQGHLAGFFSKYHALILRLLGQQGSVTSASCSGHCPQAGLTSRPEHVPPAQPIERLSPSLTEGLKARIKRLEQEVEDQIILAEQARAALVVREMENKELVKQKAVLGLRHVELEAKYNDVLARVEKSDALYSVVLLEGEPRMVSVISGLRTGYGS